MDIDAARSSVMGRLRPGANFLPDIVLLQVASAVLPDVALLGEPSSGYSSVREADRQGQAGWWFSADSSFALSELKQWQLFLDARNYA